jgi:hypothetical protein
MTNAPHPNATVAGIIERLELAPHPEGGFYRETFRDVARDATGRARSTAIYFLLPARVTSRWHRIDAVEVWHWYAGAALDLWIEHPHGIEHVVLGGDVLASERPQAIVPAGALQQAATRGEWTLAGCTVAPGFVFERFEIVDAGPAGS